MGLHLEPKRKIYLWLTMGHLSTIRFVCLRKAKCAYLYPRMRRLIGIAVDSATFSFFCPIDMSSNLKTSLHKSDSHSRPSKSIAVPPARESIGGLADLGSIRVGAWIGETSCSF